MWLVIYVVDLSGKAGIVYVSCESSWKLNIEA